MPQRSNEQWLSALRSPEPGQALSELRSLLVQGLRYALASWPKVDQDALEDFAQDALLKILAGLDSFRGESRFTTWAQKIAVHVAFTELRRRRWQNVSLQELTESTHTDFAPDTLVDLSAGPEKQALQRHMLNALQHIITTELTEKQRQALLAVRVHGMPLAEVARRMGSNRNALYKLLHDARQRLKQRMEAEGLSPQDVLAAFES
ncbi:MAG: RNA polymerase sigma factor [Chloroflexota bacterium]